MYYRTIMIGIAILVMACKKAPLPPPDEPVALTPVTLTYPKYVPDMVIPASNPTTEEGVALGRQLYYDTLLSAGGPLEGNACASCHQQAFGFTTPGPGSPPVLPHVNLGWHQYFLWNAAKAGTLEDVMLFEVQSFFQTDLALLATQKKYREGFKTLYGDESITYQRLANVLAQFLRTVNSFNSRFDMAMRGDIFFTDAEMRGYQIFNSETGDCFHCHSIGLFTDGMLHNNGLDSVFAGANVGHYAVSGNENDMGKFKTPTLRNVALRGPYMHDGRYATLEEVVNFYNSGVQRSATLDPIMTKPGKENGLGLTPQQQQDLVAFLHTLTDTSFIHNPAIGKP